MTIRIYVISRQVLDAGEITRFLRDERTTWSTSQGARAPERLVEFAGRMCYMSFGDVQSTPRNAEYLGNLISKKHESVLEHACWTLLLTGVSRSFTHQLVRHRCGFAFSQLSQQYHIEDDACFVEPGLLRRNAKARQAFRKTVAVATSSYRSIFRVLQQSNDALLASLSMKERKRAVLSAARSVLPNATPTKVVLTANARALRHFLAVRGGLSGDEEMREVCAGLLTTLQREAPHLFSDFVIEKLHDSSPIVLSQSGNPRPTRPPFKSGLAMHKVLLDFAEQLKCVLVLTGKDKTTRIKFRNQDLGYVNSTVIRRGACYGYKFRFGEPSDGVSIDKRRLYRELFRKRYGGISGQDWHRGSGNNKHRTFLCITDIESAKNVLLRDTGEIKRS
jgi:thymidylate synthase (FAD)